MFSFFKQVRVPRVVLSDGQVLDYQIKSSARSRRVRLTLTPHAGLVVTAPVGIHRRKIEEIVYGERDWISENTQRLRLIPKPQASDELKLRAIGEVWKWDSKSQLAKKGREVLVPWLEKLSTETGLRYSKVRIKGQRTRWGSCTRAGVISLNYHLLFLPPEWVRYVLIHELCHTVELNHTRAFWALVTKYVPNAKAIRKALRMAHSYVPDWI